MDSHEDRYYSYLLRLWLAYSSEEASWRASLEDPRTGERTGFAGLDDLFGYLSRQTGGSSGDDGDLRMRGNKPERGEGG